MLGNGTLLLALARGDGSIKSNPLCSVRGNALAPHQKERKYSAISIFGFLLFQMEVHMSSSRMAVAPVRPKNKSCINVFGADAA